MTLVICINIQARWLPLRASVIVGIRLSIKIMTNKISRNIGLIEVSIYIAADHCEWILHSSKWRERKKDKLFGKWSGIQVKNSRGYADCHRESLQFITLPFQLHSHLSTLHTQITVQLPLTHSILMPWTNLTSHELTSWSSVAFLRTQDQV